MVYHKRTKSPILAEPKQDKILCDLLKSEIVERKVRSIRYRMSLAKLQVEKAIDCSNFTESPVNEMQIRHLHEWNFISDHTNIIMVGNTGSGKTHLAIAIARQSIRNGRKARFFNVLDLVNQLEQEKLNNIRTSSGHPAFTG